MTGRGRHFTACIAIGLIFVLVSGVYILWKVFYDPDIHFVYSEQGAKWIRFREPTVLKVRPPQKRVTIFRTTFAIDTVPDNAILNFRAMKLAEVQVDGCILYKSASSHVQEWKKIHHINLGVNLNPGVHELRISVEHTNGHPSLLAYSIPLGLYTSEKWEASTDGVNWSYALPLDERVPLPLGRTFPRADRVFLENMHIFIPLFVCVFMTSLLFTGFSRIRWSYGHLIPPASAVRWVVLSLWLILAVNNIGKISLDIGMDIEGHMKYIRSLVDNLRIPLATEGWQMFQPPLFYVISAIIYKMFLSLLTPEVVERMMRVVPLLCGGVQIELCYRAVRYVYPERNDLQNMGVLFAGFLPMNIYISQFAGNEPLAACLSGAVILIMVRILSRRSEPTMFDLLGLGLFLGLAILTKMTVLLLIIPLTIFITLNIAFQNESEARGWLRVLRACAIILGIAFLISGWYFIRNWIEMGQVFTWGWEASRNIVWWQDPAVRTPRDFFTFGEALFYPVYSAIFSLWDGLYSTLWMDGYLSAYNRPPWNYGFMLSSAWLSLLPTAFIVSGTLSSLIKPDWKRWQVHLFSVFCVILYFSAIAYLYLSVPILSVAKATYALGVTPCLAILCVRGVAVLSGNIYTASFIYGVFACWALASYAAYFVI